MRKVIMWNIATLDGRFEGKQPWDLSFHEDVWGDELERLSTEQLGAADLLLFGRATYEGMASHWPSAKGAVADRMNTIDKVVFSNTLDSADWQNSRLVRGNAADEVASLRKQTGKNILIFGSAKLSASLSKARVIDEYRIGIAPRILGVGRPLFPLDGDNIQLRLIDTSTTSKGCVIAHYAPYSPA
jgi:dihydrofolate reductase